MTDDESESESHDSEAESDSDMSPPTKRARTEEGQKTAQVLPKPAPSTKVSKSNDYIFRLGFTNPQLLRKFMEPIVRAVPQLQFHLVISKDFTGFKLEAHDASVTLANRSKFECDVDIGVDNEGNPRLLAAGVNAEKFCVSSKSFMTTLQCSLLKDTVLYITQYDPARRPHMDDKIVFEACTNEDDIHTQYDCALLATSALESLESISFNLGFHVHVAMKTLKELCLNAKRCDASNMIFELYQAVDTQDAELVHSRMYIGFASTQTSGGHDFFTSARKLLKSEAGAAVVEYEPVAGITQAHRAGFAYERRCRAQYDRIKLSLFLNYMDADWAQINLANDNTQQPLVIECTIGTKQTTHLIMVAPKIEDDT